MRRAFRRQLRQGARQVPPILQEANLAFDKGEFGPAAELFEQIADSADARGGPRAPLFHLQAGRARVYAGQTALGIPSLKRGLALLAERKQYQRLINAKTRVLSELKARGLLEEAAEIESWLQTVAPPASELETKLRPRRNPSCPRIARNAARRFDRMKWNRSMK